MGQLASLRGNWLCSRTAALATHLRAEAQDAMEGGRRGKPASASHHIQKEPLEGPGPRYPFDFRVVHPEDTSVTPEG